MLESERSSGIPPPTSSQKNAERGTFETKDERNDVELVTENSGTKGNNEQLPKTTTTNTSSFRASENNSSESRFGTSQPSNSVSMPSKTKEQASSQDHQINTGVSVSTKSHTIKASETENSSSRVLSASVSSVNTPASTGTQAISPVHDSVIDPIDNPKNEVTETQKDDLKIVHSCPPQAEAEFSTTPPGRNSRQSKRETTICDESQQTSQAQVVVTVPQQQTLYYQIPSLPGVVTLPVEASQDNVQKNDKAVQQESNVEQQIQYSNQHEISMAQSHLPIQTEDQIIGMVGAIPIIKMQGGGVHYIKEKKGRFNLLQNTPVIPNVLRMTPTPTTSNSSQLQSDSSQNITAAHISNVSSSRSQSPLTVNTAGGTVQTVPQTFDGKSAPTVKRKGRFVVTNVKDPGSIIQIQTKPTTTGVAVIAASENNLTSSQQDQQQQQRQQQQQQQPQQYFQNNKQNQSVPTQQQRISPLQTPIQNRAIPMMQQTFQQSNVAQIPLQPVVIQPVPTIQQTFEIPQQYPQNYPHYSMPGAQDNRDQFSKPPIHSYQQNLNPQTIQYSNVPLNYESDQNYVRYLPSEQHALYPQNEPTHSTTEQVSVSLPQEQVSYNQQQQFSKQDFATRASHSVQHQQIVSSASFPINQQTISYTHSTPTPPATPGGSTSSPIHSRPPINSSLPNAPIPKPPTHTNFEKQQQVKSVNKKKSTIQGRSGKVPQSFDSNGAVSSIGLGKVFYLLDQMKMEVTDADQCIKTLQTDVKLLRDKNKDLEAKIKELDAKWREEQSLREKIERRNIDLRKKLRDAKDEINVVKQIGTSSQEENGGSHKSTESIADNVTSVSVDSKEIKQHSTTGKIPQKVKPVTSSSKVMGASPIRHTTNSDATLTGGSSHLNNTLAQSSTPSTPKAKGSSVNSKHNPPKIDLNLKDQSELKNGSDVTSRINRSRSVVKEAEQRTRTSAMETSMVSRLTKEKTEPSHKRNGSMSALATPPLIPPLRSQANGSKAPGHKHTQSLHDFDPLKSTVSVVSFPTPLSLDTFPVKTSTTSESVSLPNDLSNTYMSRNSLVMPLTFGMAPTGVRTTDGSVEQNQSPMTERQTLVTNDYHGLHQQQFMVVPQQQPIVFNQMTGGMQQQLVDNTFQSQQRNNLQSQQYACGSLQQQPAQHQHAPRYQHHQSHQYHHSQQPTHQAYTNSMNPFDPFSS